jgi:hypothetical protein
MYVGRKSSLGTLIAEEKNQVCVIYVHLCWYAYVNICI